MRCVPAAAVILMAAMQLTALGAPAASKSERAQTAAALAAQTRAAADEAQAAVERASAELATATGRLAVARQSEAVAAAAVKQAVAGLAALKGRKGRTRDPGADTAGSVKQAEAAEAQAKTVARDAAAASLDLAKKTRALQLEVGRLARDSQRKAQDAALARLAADQARAVAAAESAGGRLRDTEADWVRQPAPSGVLDIFTHPNEPAVACVTTGGGVQITEDGGLSWRPVAGLDMARIGAVRHVEFDPLWDGVLYFATDRAGVWQSPDRGRTARCVGSRQNGLAADHVERVYVYPVDHHFRSLFAVHGRLSRSVSRSFDGGTRWHVTDAGYGVDTLGFILNEAGQLSASLMTGAAKDGPDETALFYKAGPLAAGPFWTSFRSDILYADSACSPWRGGSTLVATPDKGLLLLAVDQGIAAREVGPADAGGWSSAGAVWGAPPCGEWLYAFDPRQSGLLVSGDGFASHRAFNERLPVGGLVREGARVRAAANGRVFYAAINEGLWIARLRGRGAARVTGLSVTPASVRISRSEPPPVLTITAAVEGDAAAVFADLCFLGGGAHEPLLDDGGHGDGAAGDGVYGLRFALGPREAAEGMPVFEGFVKSGAPLVSRRTRGVAPFGVSARDAAGIEDGATGALLLHDPVDGFDLSLGRAPGTWETDGSPWKREFTVDHRDLAGYLAVSFLLRRPSERPEDVALALRTTGGSESVSGVTAPVHIAKESVGSEFRRQVVTFGRLLESPGGYSPMSPAWTRQCLVLSGDGSAGKASYEVARIRFHGTQADLERTLAEPLPATGAGAKTTKP